MNFETKFCKTCGRAIEPRRKWARNWDQIRYCSRRCRSHRPGRREREIENSIVDLLRRRKGGATICPSEVARASWEGSEEGWRELMEPVRCAARRLAARGEIEFLQQGQVVDPSRARGPIRLRLRQHG